MPIEPGFGDAPVPHDGFWRNLKRLRCLLYGESTEILQLDHFTLSRVKFGEISKGIVQSNNPGQAFTGNRQAFIQGNAALLTTTPLSTSGPSVIDKDVTHGACCNPEEMSAILPLVGGEAGQTDVGFVYQGSGL